MIALAVVTWYWTLQASFTVSDADCIEIYSVWSAEQYFNDPDDEW